MTENADMFAKLAREMDGARAAAEELLAILAERLPSNEHALSAARWAFARALMQHLALMERHVYAKLEHHDRADVSSYFAILKTDQLHRFEDYTQHMQVWPTSKALRRWEEYRPGAVRAVDRLTGWLARKEEEILPYAVENSISIAQASRPRSNWVRKAFDVKSSVDE